PPAFRPPAGTPPPPLPPPDEPIRVNWRFRVPDGEDVRFDDGRAGAQRAVAGRDFGDFLVWRKDDVPSYQLACAVDDAAMGITEVVRGDDLLASTARQVLLYRALGFAARIPAFCHVPLVTGADGRRLAKRHGDTTIARYRREGVRAERIVGVLAGWLGIDGVREASPRDLLQRFDLARVPRGPVVFEPGVLGSL
ncbi:MAG TPA: glutamate--tRNA ligase family protein, partial [Planctomycetota bacterium]|nr:glutamate--tRNA ligase family protein [Planctomycetota bacterium]